jgi:hypothetical protein
MWVDEWTILRVVSEDGVGSKVNDEILLCLTRKWREKVSIQQQAGTKEDKESATFLLFLCEFSLNNTTTCRSR